MPPPSRHCSPGCCKQGIDGVVPLGGTGEYGALSRAERIRMAALSVEAMAGKGPVVAGVLDTGFHDALQAGKEFAAEGVDGAAGAHAVLYEPDPGRHPRLFPALCRRVAGADPDLRDPLPHAHRDRSQGAARTVAPRAHHRHEGLQHRHVSLPPGGGRRRRELRRAERRGQSVSASRRGGRAWRHRRDREPAAESVAADLSTRRRPDARPRRLPCIAVSFR